MSEFGKYFGNKSVFLAKFIGILRGARSLVEPAEAALKL